MLSRFVKVSPVYRKWFDFPGVLVHLRSEITDSPGVWGLLLLAGKCSYRFVSGSGLLLTSGSLLQGLMPERRASARRPVPGAGGVAPSRPAWRHRAVASSWR